MLDRDSYPEVDAFTGMEPVDWADTPSCYGKNTQHFAHYLRALVAEVPAVRRAALSRIASETLHQGTIYVATARVIPFVMRLLDHPRASVGALLDYLEAVTSQAHAYREQALEWDEDSDDRVAVLDTLAAPEQAIALGDVDILGGWVYRDRKSHGARRGVVTVSVVHGSNCRASDYVAGVLVEP